MNGCVSVQVYAVCVGTGTCRFWYWYQKRVSDPPDLDLQEIVRHLMPGTKLGSSVRPASVCVPKSGL